uniref:Vacuolar sorting-associated protein 16-like protein n=1 Tax=Aegilops tauschii TaxID=37682 RepID=M8BAS8_AEGTA
MKTYDYINRVVLTLPLSVYEGGVADAVFWGGGVAILTEDNRVVVTTDIEVDDPHPRELADPGVAEDEQVLCMAVVEPQFVMSGSPEVLLAVGDRVVAVDEDGVQVLGEALEIGPVQKMAVSPNGKLLAAFAHDGRLLVIPTDFSRIIFEYECDSALPPDQIAWCGLDSVLLYWSEVLLMVGPNGDPVQYNYDEPVMLIPECDGVRILTNSSMEFLHRVPDSTTLIFGIGSMSPAALLYDARDHYDKQSAKPAGAGQGSLQGPWARKNGTDISDRADDRLLLLHQEMGERAIPAGDVPHAVSRGAIQRTRSCVFMRFQRRQASTVVSSCTARLEAW